MFKVVFWMNIPSHYQRDFFQELNNREEIILHVCYFDHIDNDRKKLGWTDETLNKYENYVSSANDIYTIPNYKECIHVVLGDSYSFNKKLLNIIIKEELLWCHWSEPYGINCWERAHFNKTIVLLLLFLLYIKKRPYGKLIKKTALFAMGQGVLAKNNFLKWGVPEEKIRMLYYCGNKRLVTNSTLKKQLKFENKKIFLNLGQLNYRKGIDLLIKAYSKLKNKNEWILVFVGHDYSLGYYQKLVSQLNLTDRIFFLPAISPREIGNYINISDVFILPTRYDGWGIVLNEAASLGKPLIGTDRAGASWHVIKENINGYKVSASVTGLQIAMQKYIDEPELIIKHGNQSEKIFDDEFSAIKNADRFISYLKEFVK